MFGKLILLVILIAVNAMFAATEIAYLSLDKYDLKDKVKKGNKKAIKVNKIITNPSSFLATIQIGITLAGFLASAFAAESFATVIANWDVFSAFNYEIVKNISVVIISIILSYFTLVFGELLPKRIALIYPEKIAFSMVNFIDGMTKVAYPFVWILTKSIELVSKILGIKSTDSHKLTEDEIKNIIATGKEEGAIESGEKRLIFNIFEFNDTEAKEVMTKKNKMVMVDINSSEKEILRIVKESKYTRIPVYEESRNNVVGILNVKGLLLQYSQTSTIDLRKIMYEPTFVKYNEKIDDVFRKMQRRRQAIAMVEKDDEIIGLVTLEDAIEEILGNIYDEYDDKK